MNIPKKMNILGQTVNVNIVDKPLYQMHTCPKCNCGEFPIGDTTAHVCPCCGNESIMPVDNSYVLGQYNTRTGEITQWMNDNYKDVCETSLIHESIEAINSICDLKLPHQTITTLAAALYQAYSSGEVNFAQAA